MTNQQEITDEQVAQYRAAFEAALRNYKKHRSNEPWYSEEEIQDYMENLTEDYARHLIKQGTSPEYWAELNYTWW